MLAKVEYFNPGGSVKDRIAVRMVEAAEASGELKPGGTIVEPTSGNTGVGLAMVAQAKGYKCVFVCPDKVSEDKRNVLKAYGAEVVVCPTAVAPEHPDSYYNVSDRLVREIDGAWKPNQYANQNNPRSHYETTGPEIWEQTEGRITHFVAGVGTGGTISGTGKYLKEVSGGRVQIVGADPEGSVYSGGTGRPYLVEGVGEDFWPETYDKTICDRIIEVSDADSFARHPAACPRGGDAGRRLRRDGRRRGDPARARALSRPGRDDTVIVVLLPDGGRGYLTKVFNDDWLAQYGFLAGGRAGYDAPRGAGHEGRHHAAAGPHAPERDRSPRRSRSCASTASRRCRWSAPSRRSWPPRSRARSPTRTLMDALYVGHARLADRVEQHMEPPFPSLGANEPVTKAVEVLEKADALMVLDDGKPVGVLTRQDLLGHLATG